MQSVFLILLKLYIYKVYFKYCTNFTLYVTNVKFMYQYNITNGCSLIIVFYVQFVLISCLYYGISILLIFLYELVKITNKS